MLLLVKPSDGLHELRVSYVKKIDEYAHFVFSDHEDKIPVQELHQGTYKLITLADLLSDMSGFIKSAHEIYEHLSTEDKENMSTGAVMQALELFKMNVNIRTAFTSGMPFPAVSQFYRKCLISDRYCLDASDAGVRGAIDLFLLKNGRPRLTEFDIEFGTHYGVYSNENIVALVSTLNAKMGNNFRIATCVKHALFEQNGKLVVCSIIKHLMKRISARRQRSYMFTQCKAAQRRFWNATMRRSKMADILVGLFKLHHSGYEVEVERGVVNLIV